MSLFFDYRNLENQSGLALVQNRSGPYVMDVFKTTFIRFGCA